jgi:5-methylcytosine-specific restriction endonuclease McrA
MKKCTKCGVEYPATSEYFYRQGSNKGGLKGSCKECYLSEKRLYKKANAEKIAAANKIYRKANFEKRFIANKIWKKENQDKIIAYSKKYYDADPDRYRAKSVAYRKANLEMVTAKQSAYRKAHPEVRIQPEQRRKARKRKLAATLTREQWVSIKKHFDNRCAYCGKEKALTQEHFIPLVDGGEYTHNNILPACRSCNCSKNNKDFFSWYPNHKHYDKHRERKILKFLNYQNGTQQITLGL